MGILLGITGAISSGKSTFAQFLADAEPSHAIYETWHVVAEIATAFNQALKAELVFETARDDLELANQALIWLPNAISEKLHCDVTWNQLAVTEKSRLTHPELYEKLFVYIQKIRRHPDLLNEALSAHNKETYRPILQWIGGYLVAKVSKTIWYEEILRRIDLRERDTKLVIVSGVRYPSDADTIRSHGGKIIAVERPNTKNQIDITEDARNEIRPDITIQNDGSLENLQQAAIQLYDNITKG